MLCGAQDPDAPAAVLDHRKDVYLRAVEQVGGEEVQCQDPLRLGPEELRPARAVPARSTVDSGALENLPDRRRCHRDAEPGELAVDSPVAPRLVLPGQPQNHRPHLAVRCRAPGAVPARPARPPAADDVPMPAQDRAGSDNQPHPCQALRRYRPCKQRQPRPVRPRQTPMSARPLALGHSELMAQHEDLGVLPPPPPPRQAQQRHGTSDHQEDQLQAHKPKIIPPPAEQDRPGRRRALDRTHRVPKAICPGGTGFRHPQGA